MCCSMQSCEIFFAYCFTRIDDLMSQRLSNILSQLNIEELSGLVGFDVAEGLHELGLLSSKATLVNFIVKTRGYSIFHSRSARQLIFNKDGVCSLLSLDLSAAKKFSSNNWLTYAREIADLVGADYEELLPQASKRSSDFEVSDEYPLLQYQNWMRKRVNEHFDNKKGTRAIVHMPTGAGKTSTAMQIIFDQIRRESPAPCTVVWLAHSDELCEQAVLSFARLWPSQKISPAKVWRAWGGVSELENFDPNGCNFVVSSFQTLNSWLSSASADVFKRFNMLKLAASFLVVDEAHLSTARTFKNVINYIAGAQTNILGLTATPGRHTVDTSPEQTRELVSFYDNTLIGMTDNNGVELVDPISFLQKEGVLSDVSMETLPGSHVVLSAHDLKECANKLDVSDSVLSKLGDDHKRTLRVATEVINVVRERKLKTLVFCPSKNNADVLAEFLSFNGVKAASITGELAQSLRAERLHAFKEGKLSVITNFNVLTTGFDDPKIEAVIIARPTSSVVLYSQMIGRALRGKKFQGTERALVINVEDNLENLPDFKSAFTHYNKFFKD